MAGAATTGAVSAVSATGAVQAIPPSAGTALVIQQIDANGNPTGTNVTLRDRALPYRPMELPSFEQREQTDWYGGSPEATQQVFGATIPPTTMKGFWKDRFLMPGGYVSAPPATVNGQPVSDVWTLMTTVEQVVTDGMTVQVTFGQRVLRGLLKRIRPTIHNIHDIEWEMDFVWSGSGPQPPPPKLVKAPSLSNTAALIQQLSQLLSEAADVLQGFNSLITGLLSGLQIGEEIFNQTQAMLNSLQAWAANIVASTGQGLAPGFLPQALQQTQGLINLCGALVDSLDTAAEAAVSATTSLFAFGVAGLYCAQQQNALLAMAYGLGQVQADLASQVQPETAQTYVAAPSDDLRRVSIRYFGTQDQWRAIAAFNQLSDPSLTPGQIVLIPPAGQLPV